ncbi:MAG: hypothetical protein ACLPX8_24160 [Bryobacteraceae bacterium]
MTLADLLNSAAKALGKLRSGGGLCASELADGLTVANGLVDYWLTRKAFVYTTRMDEYTFSDKGPPDANNPAVYELGPGSTDWPGSVRPTRIERANIILNDSSPGVFIPLDILDVDQWADISLEQMPVTLPTKMYPDYANPNCNLYFWGQPTLPYILQLFTWQQLAAFAALGEEIAFPPGYYSAFLYSLAEVLGPQWNVQVPLMVTAQARKARAGIQSLNSRAPKLHTRDAGMPPSTQRTPYFNYRTRGF